MLILDVADDLLDDVLDGDKALGPSEFVDDDGEMHSPSPHAGEEVEHSHAFRDKQRGPHQCA